MIARLVQLAAQPWALKAATIVCAVFLVAAAVQSVRLYFVQRDLTRADELVTDARAERDLAQADLRLTNASMELMATELESITNTFRRLSELEEAFQLERERNDRARELRATENLDALRAQLEGVACADDPWPGDTAERLRAARDRAHRAGALPGGDLRPD